MEIWRAHPVLYTQSCGFPCLYICFSCLTSDEPTGAQCCKTQNDSMLSINIYHLLFKKKKKTTEFLKNTVILLKHKFDHEQWQCAKWGGRWKEESFLFQLVRTFRKLFWSLIIPKSFKRQLLSQRETPGWPPPKNRKQAACYSHGSWPSPGDQTRPTNSCDTKHSHLQSPCFWSARSFGCLGMRKVPVCPSLPGQLPDLLSYLSYLRSWLKFST